MIYLCTTGDKHIFYNNGVIYYHDLNQNLYGYIKAGMTFENCEKFVYALPSELNIKIYSDLTDRFIIIMNIIEQKIFENI